MDQVPAQDPQGTPMTSSSTRIWPAVVGGCLLALVVGVGVGLMLVWRSDDGGIRPGGEHISRTVHLEPVTYRSDSPFTESVVTMSDEELRAASSALVGARGEDRLSGQVRGDTALLYGSRSAAPPCDVARLVELLTADDGALVAWAGVMDRDPTEVPAMIQSLTPVLLGADTSVTNHTYGSDGARPLHSVLETGTPVLIDDRGTPTVQCSCGNPLLPAGQPEEPEFTGEPWESFDATQTIDVAPAEETTTELVTVDTDTSEEVTTPLGGTISLDGVLVATDSGVVVVDDAGEATTVIDRPVTKVIDDGAGGLVYTLARSNIGPDDFAVGPPADPTEGAIWHLAAGTTEAVSLTDQTDTGTWNELFAVGQLDGRTYVIYTPLHLEQTDASDPETAFGAGSLVAQDLASGQITAVGDHQEHEDGGTGGVSIGADRLAVHSGADDYGFWTIHDSSFATADASCDEYADGLSTCPNSGAMNDHGQLVTLISGSGSESRSEGLTQVVARDTASFDVVEQWRIPVPAEDDSYVFVEQVERNTVSLMVTTYSEPAGAGATTFYLADLDTGEIRDLSDVSNSEITSVWMLRAPLLRPLAPTGTGNEDPPEDNDAEEIDPASVLVDGVPEDCRIRDLVFYTDDFGDGDLVGVNPDPSPDVGGQFHSTIAPDATILLPGTDGFEKADLAELQAFLEENDFPTFLLCGSPEGWRWIEPAQEATSITSDSELSHLGIGGARIGMRFEEVEVAIGRPLHISDDLETGGECVWVTFAYGTEGLGGLGGDGILGRIDVNGGPWKTDKGIGIGATEEEVRAAYPQGLTEEPHPYDESGKYMKYQPADAPDSMTIFEIGNGAVESFRAGRTDWVELIEGCA